MIGLPRIALHLGASAVLVAALVIAAQAYVAANARSTQFRYLNQSIAEQESPEFAVDWQGPVRPLARTLNVSDQNLLATRLGSGWAAFAAAQDTGEVQHLAMWFGGPALDRAKAAAATAFENDTRMVVLSQEAAPSFVHLDGSLLQLHVRSLTARFSVGGDTPDPFLLTRDETVSTLMNRPTGWHIVAHELRDSRPAMSGPSTRSLPLPMVGVNYYPALSPWSRFWPDYDPETISTDLDRVLALGGNTIRIFLQREAFQTASAAEQNLVRLADLRAQAQTRGISVVATLFDMRPHYGSLIWNSDVTWLRTVIPVLSASPAVSLVDIKNEPDLDFALHGRAQVTAWLLSMIGVIRDQAPGLPLTIGWSHADHAGVLADRLDALSYHDYADHAGTAQRLEGVRALAAGKPVLLTEIGETAWSMVAGLPGSPRKQARNLARRLEALEQADGVLIWTLHDFPRSDRGAIGGSFWRRGIQKRFGLFDSDGNPRPSAEVATRAFLKSRSIAE